MLSAIAGARGDDGRVTVLARAANRGVLLRTTNGHDWEFAMLSGSPSLVLPASGSFLAVIGGSSATSEDGNETWRPFTFPFNWPTQSATLAATLKPGSELVILQRYESISHVPGQQPVTVRSAKVLQSSDFGLSFSELFGETSSDLQLMAFDDAGPNRGVLLSGNGRAMTTLDGGATWIMSLSLLFGPGRYVDVAYRNLTILALSDAGNGFLVREAGAFPTAHALPERANRLSMATASVGIVQSSRSIHFTNNGGFSWQTTLTVPVTQILRSAAIKPNGTGTVFAVEFNKLPVVYVTTNSGQSWQLLN
jgi:photosystem II stability/assembly factor-like uncharacterized protein